MTRSISDTSTILRRKYYYARTFNEVFLYLCFDAYQAYVHFKYVVTAYMSLRILYTDCLEARLAGQTHVK